MKLITRKVIYGCRAHNNDHSPMLTRISVWLPAGFRLYGHLFHRSDTSVFHDHPWHFWTLILWRGYIEVTPTGRRRIWPGTILYRPATWTHRVELIGERPAVTLVVRGPDCREWGFIVARVWIHWRDYFRAMGCVE